MSNAMFANNRRNHDRIPKSVRLKVCLIGVCAVGLLSYFGVQRFRGYSLSFSGIPHWSVIPNESTDGGNGLRMTIKSIMRDGDTVSLAYSIEWVPLQGAERKALFIRPFGKMDVVFWDEQHKEIPICDNIAAEDCSSLPFFLGDFAVPSRIGPYLFESDGTVEIPKRARFISMRLLKGVATKPILIPD
jgi:hypothetical protein